MAEEREWDSLMDYLERIRPGFRSRIRAATLTQLTQYEDIVGRPIYPAFRCYLERMGGYDDHLYMTGAGYSLSIENLIEDAVETRDVDCGPQFFEEFESLGSSDAVWYGLRVSGEHAGRVVRLHRCKEDVRYTPHIADSLLGYVFGYGISQEMRQLASQWSVVTAAGTQRAAIIQYLSSTFTADQHSDSVRWYGRMPNALVGVWYYPSTAAKLDIRITALGAENSMKIANDLAREFTLEPAQLLNRS